MKEIAENLEYIICEDGDSWVTIHRESKTEVDRVSKKFDPIYPLAACLKWGYNPIDSELINKLAE